MNRLMTDEAWPLWGAPAKQAQRWLTTTKPPVGAGADIPEFRATENAARKGKLQPKSVWQMHGAGAVGGQTLVGIPGRASPAGIALVPSGAVWPFGTGWRALDARRRRAIVGAGRRGVAVHVRGQAGIPASSRIRPRSAPPLKPWRSMDEAGDLSKAFAPAQGRGRCPDRPSRTGRRLDPRRLRAALYPISARAAARASSVIVGARTACGRSPRAARWSSSASTVVVVMTPDSEAASALLAPSSERGPAPRPAGCASRPEPGLPRRQSLADAMPTASATAPPTP